MLPETTNGRLTSDQRRLLGKVFDRCEDVRELYELIGRSRGESSEAIPFEDLEEEEVTAFKSAFLHLSIVREKAVESGVVEATIIQLMAARLPQTVFDHLLTVR